MEFKNPLLITIVYALLCLLLGWCFAPDYGDIIAKTFLLIPILVFVGTYIFVVGYHYVDGFFADKDKPTYVPAVISDKDKENGVTIWSEALEWACTVTCGFIALMVFVLGWHLPQYSLFSLSVPIAFAAYVGYKNGTLNKRKTWAYYVIAVAIGIMCNQCTRSCTSCESTSDGYFNEWTGKPKNPYPAGVPYGHPLR